MNIYPTKTMSAKVLPMILMHANICNFLICNFMCNSRQLKTDAFEIILVHVTCAYVNMCTCRRL